MAKKFKPEKTTPEVSIPYLKIILCLFCICTVCAGLLGATYLLTKNPIAENEAETINALLVSIYGEDAVFEEAVVPDGQTASAAYSAKSADGSFLGYAVRVLSPGFSDDIDMIVGFNADGTIRKVEIIALSETAGLGSRVSEEDYLAQYNGKFGTFLLKDKLNTDSENGIDAISGATKSSRAVLNGINTACECLKSLNA